MKDNYSLYIDNYYNLTGVKDQPEKDIEMARILQWEKPDFIHMFNALQYVPIIPYHIPVILTAGGDYRRDVYFDKLGIRNPSIDVKRQHIQECIKEHGNFNMVTDLKFNAEYLMTVSAMVLFNLIDLSKNPHIGKKTPNSIIWVGRFSPEKRPDMVLNLASRLPKYYFTMVVTDESEPVPTKYILQQNIKVIRNCTAGLDHLYKSAMFFLNTSDTEGFPLSLQEAALYGCYPICGKVGSINRGNIPFINIIEDIYDFEAYVNALYDPFKDEKLGYQERMIDGKILPSEISMLLREWSMLRYQETLCYYNILYRRLSNG